jgi:ESCRT-II complex subunit VPS36
MFVYPSWRTGIISPVTKLSAGRQYYHLLARQVADLLYDQNRITRLGGVVSLTDLYCLYNRARGTELVSPDDLLQAVRLMDSLHLGEIFTLNSFFIH